MNYPHRIRLRGPWDFAPLAAGAGGLFSRRRVEVPTDWGESLGLNFQGGVRYRRRFAKPTGIEPHERLWLVIEGVDACGRAALNGTALGTIRGYALPEAFDITPLIKPRNELLLDVFVPAAPGGPPTLRPGREGLPGGPLGEVYLEVRPHCYPDRMCLEVREEGQRAILKAWGEVVGSPAWGPLSVLAASERGELLYADLPSSGPFLLEGEVEGMPAWPAESVSEEGALLTVEVRLISGAFGVGAARFRTARRKVEWDIASQALRVADCPIRWPVPPLAGLEAAAALRSGQKGPAPVGCRMVYPTEVYDFLGECGVAVVQAMPLEWAAEVCPRLAHHPAIVAWSAPRAELERLPEEHRKQGVYGRPWVPSELAFEDP